MYRSIGKRLLDSAAAFILLIVLSWLILLITFVFYLNGYRNVFFRQRRIGKDERPFWLVKFRTLQEDESVPLKQRQFTFGSFLRATSLDELPQLWNVIRGEMSFVGPRPLPWSYLPLFSESQRLRHRVFPGITGWAQVNGRTSIRWTEKFAFDTYYVEHLSFLLDLKIILKTLVLILSFKRDGSLEEKPFTGHE